MRIGFITSVQLGLSCMEEIYNAGGKLDFAMTLPDKIGKSTSGRVFLDRFCNRKGISLLKSTHVNNSDVIASIHAANIDWLFIVGWSQIASKSILRSAKKGVIGIHPTLLPQGRGRAAIPWAIMKRLNKTGVTLFKMDEGVDSGPIGAQVEIQLAADTSATELYAAVVAGHKRLIRTIMPDILSDSVVFNPQDGSKATYWPERKPEDGEIDLDGSVYDAERLVRAVTRPYPGAYYYQGCRKCTVWSAKVMFESSKTGEACHHLTFRDGVLLIKEFEFGTA